MKRIAVLTSGGDSAGMNAAVRAVVRKALTRGCQVYVIREGWQGLVSGNSCPDPDYSQYEVQKTQDDDDDQHENAFIPTYGEARVLKEALSSVPGSERYIIRVGWDDVRGFLSQGGTIIGTARCSDFRQREGRLKAAYNLVSRGIDGLVVCGGDGSLTGADILRQEWPGLLDDLAKQGQISSQEASKYPNLNIAGLVGSIDNDMASTDLTIGAETALHRISEAVDCISSTASSHSRAFVIEVMGRHCGWLALQAAIACSADFLFIPERPPTDDEWENEMCRVLQRHRELGKRKSIIIVAEGATDKNLKPITADMIKNVLSDRVKLDTRVTTLGHTQRGGPPCAYDRVLATLQGCEAVDALLDNTPDTPSPIICIEQSKITRKPLVDAVKQTKEVARLIEEDKNFDKAVELRNFEFAECLYAFKATTRLNEYLTLPSDQRMRIGIMHMGAPAGGMNAATVAAARYCLGRGHTPLGIYDSWSGLLEDYVQELSWIRVDLWGTKGGSELGTNRSMPYDAGKIGRKLAEHGIDALLIIGGYEVYRSLDILAQARNGPNLKVNERRGLAIPMVHIPATISNNVPITEWSLGSDTSINVLTQACDMVKQSASASRNRVFVMECQGGHCGYMAMVGGLASGACSVYTPEEGLTLEKIRTDVAYFRKRYSADRKGGSEGRLVIMNEKASNTYTTSVVQKIFGDEGKPLFDSRMAVMGHTLQGGIPTPRDRARAVRLAIRGIQFLELSAGKVHKNQLYEGSNKWVDLHKSESSPKGMGDMDMGIMVVHGTDVKVASLEDMAAESDTCNRRPIRGWWEDFREVMTIMAGRKMI